MSIFPCLVSIAVAVAIVFLGRFITDRIQRSSADAMEKLTKRQSEKAILQRVDIVGGMPEIREEIIPVGNVRSGEVVIVKPGAIIPIDGQVSSGSTYVDESIITGASEPAKKTAGDKVYAGTLNQNGYINVRCINAIDTKLSAAIGTVRAAMESKAPGQDKMDKIAKIYWFVVIGLSFLTLAAWIFFDRVDGLSRGLVSMAAVLLIASPRTLKLAIPTAIKAGISRGAEKGIFIKDAESLLSGDDASGGDASGNPELLKLSRRCKSVIRGNLFISACYNIFALPFAALLLYPAVGPTLAPILAAICMALSSLCVVTNTLRIKHIKP